MKVWSLNTHWEIKNPSALDPDLDILCERLEDSIADLGFVSFERNGGNQLDVTLLIQAASFDQSLAKAKSTMKLMQAAWGELEVEPVPLYVSEIISREPATWKRWMWGVQDRVVSLLPIKC